jgi:hypothetical protein
VERQGLGGALRQIVEKTLKEQAEQSGTADTAAVSTEQRSESLDWSIADWAGESVFGPQSKSTGEAERANTASAKAPPATPNPASRGTQGAPSRGSPRVPRSQGTPSQKPGSNSKPSGNGFGTMAADIWRAISAVPAAGPGTANSTSRSAANPSDTSTSITFQWARLPWALAALALTVTLLYWLARRRHKVREALASDEAHWVQAILKSGIRTRADVVRAFHYFVHRRPQPVADWRTHRYVADRLCDASPHLRSAILELTSVYEQARYLPPEEQLSADQIVSVHEALRQCDACSV